MNDNKIKFTIITVVKNAERKILKTMKSVKAQSFHNFEHIIVDGKSTDGTKKIIKNNNYDQVKFFELKDKNLYDAINFALKKTKGEFILFLHAGDLFFSINTLKNINKIIKTNTDVIIGGCVFFDKKNEIFRVWKVKDNVINKLNAYKVAHTGAIINKRVINEVGLYNINYNISSDTDYLLRVFTKKKNIKAFSSFICFMEMGGLSTNYKTLFKKITQDIQIYFHHFRALAILYYLFKIIYKISHFKDRNFFNDYKVRLNKMIKLTSK